MKTKPSAIKSLLAAALAASCLASYAAAPQKREMKFEKLRKEFADPPRAFRPAPLWVWNTRVTRADIDRMLGDFKAQGFGGAFVHPRPGLVTEYLSDEWFDLYKYSVEKGKELGLDIWIYDENSYPSGFAGGHVPAQMPESYDQGQGLALTKTALPPADAGKYFLCLKKEGGTFRDITADTGRYKDVPGEYYLYEKTYYGRSGWHGGYSYVDLLVEGVTEKFLDITMSGYEKTFGNELGPVIRGLFSDEPCIPSSGGVRWTPDLFEVFRKQWGYDLATSLPLLSEQTGDWKQVRHNYLETLTQMFVDRWAKPMSAYCDRKGMLWTGHYWEHDWPSMYQGGDNMAMYAWHQMPAIDMLFNQYNDQSPVSYTHLPALHRRGRPHTRPGHALPRGRQLLGHRLVHPVHRRQMASLRPSPDAGHADPPVRGTPGPQKPQRPAHPDRRMRQYGLLGRNNSPVILFVFRKIFLYLHSSQL